MKLIASISETSVKISLQSVILKPIAEPLAIPTCSVSFRSFIRFCFGLTFQVGLQLSYVSFLRFIIFLHYVKSGVKKSLSVSLVPLFVGFSRFIPA